MGSVHLGMLAKGKAATITRLAQADSAGAEALRLRLMELGFVPGEEVRVLAESFPGRDPIAVRLGSATFALRRYEAAMIEIDTREP
jgi:ferrous iron transport protein A